MLSGAGEGRTAESASMLSGAGEGRTAESGSVCVACDNRSLASRCTCVAVGICVGYWREQCRGLHFDSSLF